MSKTCDNCSKDLVRKQKRFCSYSCANSILKIKYPIGYGVRSRLHNIWKAMIFRCYYPSHAAYKRYSKNKITVCHEWKESYENFLNWALENGYKNNLQIDRINNTKSYFPENCRFVTALENSRNKNNTIIKTAFGETKKLMEWSEDKRCIVSYHCLNKRIKTGRTLEWSLTTPQNVGRRRNPMSEKTKLLLSQKAKLRFSKL